MFGPAARNRTLGVLASEAVNPDVSRRLLACNGSGLHADVLAVAPYFTPAMTRGNSRRDSDVLTLDAMFNASAESEWAFVDRYMRGHKEAADQYGLQLMLYESGTGLVNENSIVQTALAIAYNRDPRVEQVLRNYTESMLSRLGVSRMMYFSHVGLPSRYGSWGIIESLDQAPADAPKLRGLLAAASALAPSQCRDAGTHWGRALWQGAAFSGQVER